MWRYSCKHLDSVKLICTVTQILEVIYHIGRRNHTLTLAKAGFCAYLLMLSLEMSMNGPPGSVSMDAVPSLTWRPEAVVTGLPEKGEGQECTI